MARRKTDPNSREGKALLRDAIKQKKAAVKNAAKLTKEIKKRDNALRKEQVKTMRPFMKKLKGYDLRKGLTSGQKSFVSKSWDEYTKLTTRGHHVYRSKDKGKVAAAQKYARHGLDKSAPKFDVAFIPTALEKPKVKIDKSGTVSVSNKYVKETAVYFDIENLVKNPEAEIARILAENPDSKQFVLMAGEYTVNGGLDRGTLAREALYWISRYSPGGDGYQRRGSNSYFANWLLGAIVVETKNQKDFQYWIKAYRERSGTAKKQKKQQRDKFARKYGKKK